MRLLFLVPLVLFGCSRPAPPTTLIGSAREGVTGLTYRLDDIGRTARLIQPYAEEPGQVLAQRISDSAEEGVKEAKEVDKTLGQALDATKREAEKFTKLDSKWYVRTGRFLERLFLWIVGLTALWFVLGIGSTLMGITGIPILRSLSATIVRIIPFANPFSSLRDSINGVPTVPQQKGKA